MKCPNCQKNTAIFFFKAKNIHGSTLINKDEFPLFKCQSCGLIFPDIKISKEYYQKYYRENYYQRKPGLIGLLQKIYLSSAHLFMQRAIKIIISRGKILDFGCGKGDFLVQLSDNFEKYGVEINPQAVKFIKKNYPSLKIFNDLKKIPRNLKFDLISLWHVIEHLENGQVLIKNISKLLTKKGLLIIATPNTAAWGFSLTREYWFHLDAPRHLALYNRDNLLTICQQAGLKTAAGKQCKTDYPLDVFWSLLNKFKKNNLLYDFPLLFFIFPFALIIKIISLLNPGRSEIMTLLLVKK